MGTLRFSDGMSFDTGGKLRAVCRSDGWYVVGEGTLQAVEDREAADKLIEQMSNHSDNKGDK